MSERKKVRLTFEVDQVALFDALSNLGGDTSGIGNRVVGVMLGNHASFADHVGMAVYGITLIEDAS